MRFRVVGAGFYGCSIGLGLIADGHDVEIFEAANRVFAGASGNCPARLHLGAPHYPRSGATQLACKGHQDEFLDRYGFLTRHVPTNIYAVADKDSLVDFDAYRRALAGQVEFITIHLPAEYGLQNVEGAVLTGERHIVADMAAAYLTGQLAGRIRLESPVELVDDPRWDMTIDCTFSALNAEDVDRYEPCLTVLLEGPTDRATTIVDGGFAGVYVWNESWRLSSLTSASLTPLSKTCRTYGEALALLRGASVQDLSDRADLMMDQMAYFWPQVRDLYTIADCRLAIRAMPRSGADSRLAAVKRAGPHAIRVRAGKIDAVLQAERMVKALLPPYARIALL